MAGKTKAVLIEEAEALGLREDWEVWTKSEIADAIDRAGLSEEPSEPDDLQTMVEQTFPGAELVEEEPSEPIEETEGADTAADMPEANGEPPEAQEDEPEPTGHDVVAALLTEAELLGLEPEADESADEFRTRIENHRVYRTQAEELARELGIDFDDSTTLPQLDALLDSALTRVQVEHADGPTSWDPFRGWDHVERG